MSIQPKLLPGLLCGIFLLVSCAGKKDQTKNAIDKAEKWLFSMQEKNGCICDSSDKLFDIWETVNALNAIAECDPASAKKPEFKNGLDYISQNRHSSGLICHNVKCKDSWCLETSAILLMLASHKEISNMFSVDALGDSLAALQPEANGLFHINNPDVKEAPLYPSVTGLLLTALDRFNKKNPYDSIATHALISAQNADGNWNAAWEYYGTPAYALWAILPALIYPSRKENAQTAIEKAKSYIKNSFVSGEGWNYKMPERKFLPSNILQTALMLEAAHSIGLTDDEKCISEGLKILLLSQKENGSWNGGYFPAPYKSNPKREDIFATAHAMIALHLFSKPDV